MKVAPKAKLDELFIQWLGKGETQSLVRGLVAAAGTVEKDGTLALIPAPDLVCPELMGLGNDNVGEDGVGSALGPNVGLPLSPTPKEMNGGAKGGGGGERESVRDEVKVAQLALGDRLASTTAQDYQPSSPGTKRQREETDTFELDFRCNGDDEEDSNVESGMTRFHSSSSSRDSPASESNRLASHVMAESKNSSPLHAMKSSLNKYPKKNTLPRQRSQGLAGVVSGTDTVVSSSAQHRSYAVIPQFYFPGGWSPLRADERQRLLSKTRECFRGVDANQELREAGMVDVVTEVMGLSSYFTPLVMEKIGRGKEGGIFQRDFERWFFAEEAGPGAASASLAQKSPSSRAFEILRRDNSRSYLLHEDLMALVNIIVSSHPGLVFLKDTPEFQDRYAETVVYTVFYSLSKRLNGRISRRDFERSDFLASCKLLDCSDDTNASIRYFSYEHFYVIYCKFWELDTDRDHLLSIDDLVNYGNQALSRRIIERIFDGVPRKVASGVDGRLNYEDFTYFILSEEDKTTTPAMLYWFRCLDLDGDGLVSRSEMEYFYEEQRRRMENTWQELILFDDILCQLVDLLKPPLQSSFSLKDLLRANNEAGPLFFNVFMNLSKFMAFEMRDPLMARIARECDVCEWDRFAHNEYARLASGDEYTEFAEPDDNNPNNHGSFDGSLQLEMDHIQAITEDLVDDLDNMKNVNEFVTAR